MTHRGHLTIAILVIGFVIVLTAAFLLGRSALLDNELLRARLVQKLAEWTGGDVELKGPVRVSYLPTLSVEFQNVAVRRVVHLQSVASIETRRLDVGIALWSLINGDMRVSDLQLNDPRIELRTDGSETSGGAGQDLVRVLRSAPFSSLRIEGGVVAILDDLDRETLSALNLDASLSPEGASHADGNFTWREQTVAFHLDLSTPTLVANTATSPLELRIESPLLTGRISGAAALADAAQVTGALELDIPNLRRFVNWTGLLVPDGVGLGAFTASGSINWVGRRISVDDGAFRLDGNDALGTLALEFSGPRPALEGTLALRKFAIDRYIDAGAKPAGKSITTSRSPDLVFPLLHHFDVDLRISAAALQARSLSVGETAVTAVIRSGLLTAEFSSFDLCGGQGVGRLELNAAKSRPKMQVSAKVTNFTPENCIELLWAESPIRGSKGELSLSLSSTGGESRDLVQNLEGKLNLKLQAGEIRIDPLKVVDAARKGTLRGWGSVLGSARGFESLSTAFRLERGNAKSESFEVVTEPALVTGDGVIDISTSRLHWRLRIADKGDESSPRIGAFVAELVDSLIVQGPLSEPVIQLERKSTRHPPPAENSWAHMLLGNMH